MPLVSRDPPGSSTHLKISTDTMHLCVSNSTIPKNTMHMLTNKLDGGAIPMHPDAMEVRVHLSKKSPWSACTPSWMTKLGISSPPSPSQACQRVGLITTDRVSVMSCMDFLSRVVSHEYMCIVM